MARGVGSTESVRRHAASRERLCELLPRPPSYPPWLVSGRTSGASYRAAAIARVDLRWHQVLVVDNPEETHRRGREGRREQMQDFGILLRVLLGSIIPLCVLRVLCGEFPSLFLRGESLSSQSFSPTLALIASTSMFSLNFGRLTQIEWKLNPPLVISSIACCLVQPSITTRYAAHIVPVRSAPC